MESKKSSNISPENPPRTCTVCQGRGWIDIRCETPDRANRCSFCNGKGVDAGGKECYACHGTGLLEVRAVDKKPCPQCSGAGVFPVPPSMTVWDFAYHPGKKK